MKVSSQYAADHLDDLLTAAQNGEDVQIASPNQASIRLTLVVPAPEPKPAKRILGAGRGQIGVPSWEEWDAMEIASEMNEGPLVPGETRRDYAVASRRACQAQIEARRRP